MPAHQAGSSLTHPLFHSPHAFLFEKILYVFDTRPEAIKRALLETLGVVFRSCSSGQHREMGSKALSAFELEPHIVLDTMISGQSLTSLTSQLLSALDALYGSKKLFWVLLTVPPLSLDHWETQPLNTLGSNFHGAKP